MRALHARPLKIFMRHKPIPLDDWQSARIAVSVTGVEISPYWILKNPVRLMELWITPWKLKIAEK